MLLPWTSDILTNSLKHKYQKKPVIIWSVTEWEINLCLQRCTLHTQGIVIKHIWELFLLQGKIFLCIKHFHYMWSVLIRQLHYVPWKLSLLTFSSSTCCVRNKLQSYFSSRLQILEMYWKIRETHETTGERDAVSTFQSFSIAWVEVPAGPCRHLNTICSFCYCKPALGFFLRANRITQNEDYAQKQWLKPTILTSKIQPFIGLSVLCQPVCRW